MKFKLNKINYKSILSGILGKRNLFLMVFFGALLIYNFNAIYQEAYVKLMYLDSSEALKVFDGKRETIIIKKLTENLKLREDRIQKELLNDHKNIFIYEPIPSASIQNLNTETVDGATSESGNASGLMENPISNITDLGNTFENDDQGAENPESTPTPQ